MDGARREEPPAPPDRLVVGGIGRPHGIHGEVAVRPLTEVASRFDPGSVLRTDDGRTLTVRRSRPHHGRLLVGFEEIADRTAAEALRGRLLLVPPGHAPPLEEDAFWVHEVVGLEVVTEEGRSLGRVAEVLGNPANDIWVVRDGQREHLVPALREVVVEVDLDAGRAVVREVPGLTTPEPAE